MPFNIVNTLNVISGTLGGLATGVNKLIALDNLEAGLILDLAALNLIDVALGGAGGFVTVTTVLADIAIRAAVFSPVGGVTSGTYLPVASDLGNLDSVTPQISNWMRVGNIVTVGFSYLCTPTGGGGCSFRMTLPIASNFGTTVQAPGIVNTNLATTATDGIVVADNVQDLASPRFLGVANLSVLMSGIFVYKVI